MLEQTSYYGLVDEDFLDAIDPCDTTVADSLYANDNCFGNSADVDVANHHDIQQMITSTMAANDTYWRCNF